MSCCSSTGPWSASPTCSLAISTRCAALDELDVPAVEARVRTIREVIGERQRYIEIS